MGILDAKERQGPINGNHKETREGNGQNPKSVRRNGVVKSRARQRLREQAPLLRPRVAYRMHKKSLLHPLEASASVGTK